MEIPVINSLTNPSLISQFFPQHRLFKWGALFVALLYAFTSLSYRIKVFLLFFHRKYKSLLSSASDPLISSFNDEFSDISSSDDDVSCSSDEDYGAAEEQGSSYEDLTRFHGDFRVKGSFGNFRLRRRRSIVDNCFSLSELANGNNGVVKLWENSILGEIPADYFSPEVVVSGEGDGGVLGLGLWDLRMGRKSAAVQSQWGSGRKGRAVGIDPGRTGKVYVRDDVGMAVGDVRKVDKALEEEEETW